MPRRKPTAPSTTAEREQYWLRHLRAAKADGSTLVAYAAAQDLNVHHLYHWKRVLDQRGLLKATPSRKSASAFVPVVAAAPTTALPQPPATPALTIKLAHDIELHFHRPLDPAQLSALINALRATP